MRMRGIYFVLSLMDTKNLYVRARVKFHPCVCARARVCVRVRVKFHPKACQTKFAIVKQCFHKVS